MKYSLLATFLLLGSLHADDSFIMTNSDAKEEKVESLTTSDGEFETLFEIVDVDESPSLGETEKLLTPAAVQDPVLTAEATPAQEGLVFEEAKKTEEVATAMEPKKFPIDEALPAIKINFNQVFAGSPIIYSLLLLLSILAFFIWLYSQIHLRNLVNMSETVSKNLRNRLTSNQYDEALALCLENDNLFCKMLASGISVRKYGFQMMVETMKAEGKRATVKFWQKISLLNDIAIIAPMLGLLGTVLGMFYAFYDVNRSVESVSALFDGLGISVGTTLAGLMVAILAMMLHSIARYRLVKRLANIENEVQAFATIIDNKI